MRLGRFKRVQIRPRWTRHDLQMWYGQVAQALAHCNVWFVWQLWYHECENTGHGNACGDIPTWTADHQREQILFGFVLQIRI